MDPQPQGKAFRVTVLLLLAVIAVSTSALAVRFCWPERVEYMGR